MISGISEKNRLLLDKLNNKLNGPFSIIQASQVLSISVDKTRILLAYFARAGWLSRVRRGLYITVPLGTVNPQDYRENTLVVANSVFSPCYIGGWSAAEHWELTDQIFNSVVVFTNLKFRRRNIRIQGTDYVVKFTNKKLIEKTKAVWIANTKINFSDPTQTIADILNDPTIGGGIRHAGDIMKSYFESEYRNDSAIVNAIKNIGNKTVFKRLGFLIEALNIKADELVNECRSNVSKGYSLLDPSVESKGKYNRRWNLLVNVLFKR